MTVAGTDIDAAALESHLSAELGVTVVDAEVVHDGLNLSVVLATEADGRAYVLRRPNKLRGLESFNDPEREFGVLERLCDTAVPAPEPVLLGRDESVVGGPFLVMTHLDGESIPLGADPPERFQRRAARRRLATVLIDALADLHSVDVAPFESVCERRPVRDHVATVTDQFEVAVRATGHEPPAFREVADWLRENVPPDSRTAVVHGDYRPSNVLFAGTDRPRVTGVLDWETTFLGDPLTELGYLVLRWRDDGDPTPSLDDLESRYPDHDALPTLRDRNERGLAPFTAEPGSPSRRELVGRYENRTGLSFEHERFYRAFAAFTLASVWEDLHRHRVDAGAESDWEPYVDYMTTMASSIVSGGFPL